MKTTSGLLLFLFPCSLISFVCLISDDADQLRIHTLSEAGDLDSLEKMVDNDDSDSDSEKPKDMPSS